MRKFTVLLICIMLVVLGLGAVLVIYWMQDIPADLAAEASLTASVSDAGGIDTSSIFSFTFPDSVGAVAVNRSLTVEPTIEMGIHQGSTRQEVLLVPNELLEEGTAYTFTLHAGDESYSWVFETKASLHITQIRPQDRTTNVACTSHIEIVLDKLFELDLSRVEEYVHISPQVSGRFHQNGRVLYFIPDSALQPDTVYTVSVAAGLPVANSSVCLQESYSTTFETASAVASLWYVDAEAYYPSGSAPSFMLQVAPSSASATEIAATVAVTDEPDAALSAVVQLYKFEDAGAYAAALSDVAATYPVWSHSFEELHDLPLSHTVLQASHNILLEAVGSNYRLQWPQVVEDGFYLLRISWQGQSRDLLFCVSRLSAYVLSDSSSDLLWLHDLANGAVIGGTATNVISGDTADFSQDGVLHMERSGAGVYLIEAVDTTLVIPVWQASAADTDNYDNWRYLYISQSEYDAGDSLYFWGLALPRDGSELEYQRVSVYIVPQNAGIAEYVYFDYAALHDNMFWGSIELPLLMPGQYSLQIWQSGRCLVSRSFNFRSNSTAVADSVSKTSGWYNLQLDSEQGYAIGDSFAVAYNKGEGNYLFIEAENGIGEIVNSNNGLYLDRFAPKNYLNSYVQALFWDGKSYSRSVERLLSLSYSDRELQIEIIEDADLRDIQQESILQITDSAGVTKSYAFLLRDKNGEMVENAYISLSIVKGQPVASPLDAIYTDYQASGLSNGQGRYSYPANVVDTLFFVLGTSSEDGYFLPQECYGAELDALVLPADSEYSLLVQAICLTGEVQAGSACYPLQQDNEQIDSEIVIQPETNTDIPSEKTVIEEEGSSLLWTQQADGGVGEAASDIRYSALAALLTGGAAEAHWENLSLCDISAYGLKVYFHTLLSSPYTGREEQCAALSALAALGEPVLNEVKFLLHKEDLQEEERLWLLAALYEIGDHRVARSDATMHGLENIVSAEACLSALIEHVLPSEDIAVR